MTNEDWKYKILNASPKKLVIVTYEIILCRLGEAVKALESGDEAGFREAVNNAKDFLNELTTSLDMTVPIARSMADLYLFVNKMLIKAYFSRDRALILKAGSIIKKLKSGLEKEADDTSEGLYESAAEVCENYSDIAERARRR